MTIKLKVKSTIEYPHVTVEVEPFDLVSATELMANFYTVERVRKDALHKLKASIHAYADSLTENDLEVV
jgi:hypothetical protein